LCSEQKNHLNIINAAVIPLCFYVKKQKWKKF
jgi:hypothetical protein